MTLLYNRYLAGGQEPIARAALYIGSISASPTARPCPRNRHAVGDAVAKGTT